MDETPSPPVPDDTPPDNPPADYGLNQPVVKSRRWQVWGLVGAGVLVAAVLVWWLVLRADSPQANTGDQNAVSTIDSYDDCVAAGYPVAESFPEQCIVPGGQTFTRELTEKELYGQETQNASTSDLITELTEAEYITLAVVGDEKKLPNPVPDSFTEYIEGVLSDNDPDENGCITLFSVLRISTVNISGTLGSADPDTLESGNGCGGAAATFWYFKNDQWQQLSVQDAPSCEVLEKTTIYSEFLPQCYPNPGSGTDPIPNPNGSIDDADT